MSLKSRFVMALSLIDFVREKFQFFDAQEDKIAKYWEGNSRNDIIEKADKLFEEEKYIEVYEHLNKIKHSKDIDIIWRIAKALFNISLTPDLTNETKKEMMGEAYEILAGATAIGKGKGNYYKWMAIITNRKNGLESLEHKVTRYPEIRDHLIKASEHSPKDYTGRWHYEMANLTWFQRKIAKYLYKEPPVSDYHEAYRYLSKAEELQPRSFLPNVYLLGLVCMKIGQNYRARYYLQTAMNLPVHNECEKCCATNASFMLSKLEKYDLGKDLLFDHYQFGFEN
ncbi:regulator of microtubule dynamics protein 1-like isoform X2 [Anthonomus grandis grandis]|uniref:regulator of microtubule dynamics protein 1-like isoform X2 n=1 Tax=Anthonomus grandis grandis TaxID=2921223 RepID=UPI0021659992|nr:regulator of microtubule dynamics protein 1-like isoform X2 [Anthonomus grandis grandis]